MVALKVSVALYLHEPDPCLLRVGDLEVFSLLAKMASSAVVVVTFLATMGIVAACSAAAVTVVVRRSCINSDESSPAVDEAVLVRVSRETDPAGMIFLG